MQCDASSYALGIILSQIMNGEENPFDIYLKGSQSPKLNFQQLKENVWVYCGVLKNLVQILSRYDIYSVYRSSFFD